MSILRTIINWGWSPALITVLAIVGYIYQWPAVAVAPLLVVVLVVGLVVAVIRAKEKQLELSSLKLRQLAGYFNRRFAGDSALSIFAVIDSLFSIDNPQLRDWAHTCGTSQRVFNAWCSSFVTRLEGETRSGKLGLYLHTHLNELWLINSRYYEFIEQFCDIAEKFELTSETIGLYDRFTVEYNVFVQNFRDHIAQLKREARTEIEAPSVKLARELVRLE